MTPHVVVDVGNSRVKWGVCAPTADRITHVASLPAQEAMWAEQLRLWIQTSILPPGQRLTWVLASVRPQDSEQLASWIHECGDEVVRLEKAIQLPLEVALEKPDHVGIDRLLDAVAARKHLSPGQGAILVDAGSAVTVDWLDEKHAFRGGTILPGLRLMAQALHDHTALLPLVTIPNPLPALPGENTIAAMQLGIFHAVRAGIDRIVEILVRQARVPPRFFLTGGDASALYETPAGKSIPSPLPYTSWPEQTLAGILFSVESLRR